MFQEVLKKLALGASGAGMAAGPAMMLADKDQRQDKITMPKRTVRQPAIEPDSIEMDESDLMNTIKALQGDESVVRDRSMRSPAIVPEEEVDLGQIPGEDMIQESPEMDAMQSRQKEAMPQVEGIDEDKIRQMLKGLMR